MYVAIKTPYTGNILEKSFATLTHIPNRQNTRLTDKKCRSHHFLYAPQPSINHDVHKVQFFFLGQHFRDDMEREESANHEERFQEYEAFEITEQHVVNHLQDDNGKCTLNFIIFRLMLHNEFGYSPNERSWDSTADCQTR